MNTVFIVVETQTGDGYTDATAYATREDAVRALENLSGKYRDEWENDDSTVYDGDNNYETVGQIIESKVYDNVPKVGE